MTSAPPPLSSRFGGLGSLAKRVMARLIRFYTFQQDAVNRDVEERLLELEGTPEAQHGGQIQLRAQMAALSARLTHVQREVAPLRAEIAELQRKLDALESAPE